MFEFAVRIVATFCLGYAGTVLQAPSAGLLLKIAMAVGAYSVFLFLLQRRGLRTISVSTFFAGADSLAIAFSLGAIGIQDRLGFLTLAPVAYAVFRFGSPSATLAPIAAGAVVAAQVALGPEVTSTVGLAVQAVAILATGLLMTERIRIVEGQAPEPIIIEVPAEESLELRESFRRLQEDYRHLETQSQKDKRSLTVRDLMLSDAGDSLQKASAWLMSESKISGLAICRICTLEGTLSVIASSGAVPPSFSELSVKVDREQPVKKLSLDLHSAIGDVPGKTLAATILRHRGKVCGAVLMLDADPESVRSAVDTVEQISAALAETLIEERERQWRVARLTEAELLYDLSTGYSGAKSPATLAKRAVADLAGALRLDGAAIWLLENGGLTPLAIAGQADRFIDSIRFSSGEGLEGWIKLGSPEIGVANAYEDVRLTPRLARELQLGSYAICPIRFSEDTYAILTASSKRIAALDHDGFDMVRRVASELGQRFGSFEGADLEDGLATATELQTVIAEGASGCLVYLEPHRRTGWIERFGKPAFDNAIREYGRRLRPRLPAGSLIVRRPKDDFIVLLKDVDLEFATSWANECAAMASFIGLRVPGEDRRLPLGMRAKVAAVGSQKDEISANLDEALPRSSNFARRRE